jgi:prepilin-type processing-associated H-X9-DG protein
MTAGVLAGAGMVAVRKGQPLPLHPAGSKQIGPGAALLETPEGGVVSLWGMITSFWDDGDVVGRRLAAVSLVKAGTATQAEVCAGFEIGGNTLRRWIHLFDDNGVLGLAPEQRGPKGPSKITEDLTDEMRGMRSQGLSLAVIAGATGVSTNTVRRALLGTEPSPQSEPAGGDLIPLAPPSPREAERALARFGLLSGAEPVITEGASLPVAGSLLILPSLSVTGLLDVFSSVYASGRAAFYSLRSLVLALVFCALVGEPRAEGLTRISPLDLGRLIGLDRAPEVGTMRRRMDELAGARRSGELLAGLARHHADAHPDQMGVLYLDGHVRAYHGGADLPRAHLARARIAMAATTDTWLTDSRGDAVLVWGSMPGAALTGELRRAVIEVRELLGPDARPTIAFDRGGWSPACFAEIVKAGFHILTYRKGPLTPEPERSFMPVAVTDGFGHKSTYYLAERSVRIAYDKGRHYFSARQVTRLDEKTGHQTQVITTWGAEHKAFEVACSMFSRWREENLFRFMRPRGLDAMDSYAKMADDRKRLVTNPKKNKAKRVLDAARASLAAIEATEGKVALLGDDAGSNEVTAAYKEARRYVEELEADYRAIPKKIALGEARPGAVVLDDERKRLHDAIRMGAWNAESALARALGPHFSRAEDEAHSLLSETFKAPADIEIVGDELHVRIDALSAPRRSRAIAGLCAELTATETLYPGTELRLVYSVKGY